VDRTQQRRKNDTGGRSLAGWFRREWHEHTAETAFLLIGICFGLLFVFLIPPTQAADETTHFYRAYQLSEGHVSSVPVDVHGYGDYLPAQILTVSEQLFGNIPSHYNRKFNYHQLPPLLKKRIDFNDLVPVHIEGAAVYSPAGYMPQVAAIEVAKVVWPSVLVMYYLGRLANLVVWLTFMYIALRMWPGNKWALFALALIPMSLSQGATLSVDATINSLAFLIISGAFYLSKRSSPLDKKQIFLAFLAIIWVSLSKPVMFVLALLGFILTTRLLVSRKRYLLLTLGLVFAGVIVTALWSMHVNKYTAAEDYYYYPKININESKQLIGIIKHPIHYLYVLGNTYLTQAGNLMATTFIGRLGWWDVDMPLWLVTSAYILITMAIVNREPRERGFSSRERLVSALVFVAGFLAVNTVLYLTITKVGANYIDGLQGRYLIAFSPLLIAPFAGLLQVKDWNKIAARVYPIAYVIILSTSLIVTVNRFR
jgi:uncharacterized membrane protein